MKIVKVDFFSVSSYTHYSTKVKLFVSQLFSIFNAFKMNNCGIRTLKPIVVTGNRTRHYNNRGLVLKD